MALPFFTPIMNLLPDGGVYDVETGAPIQQTNTPLATTVASNTADIDAQIAAAKAERDKIKSAASKPGLGPKATATRQQNLATAQSTLKSLQDEKKQILAKPVFEPAPKPVDENNNDDDTNDDAPVYTAPDGETFPDAVSYAAYLKYLSGERTSNTDAAIAAANKVSSNKNAREFLIASLKPYFASAQDADFLTQLTKVIDDYISQDYDVDTISVLLPQTDAYKTRFKGNTERANAGLSMLSPAEYIQAEEQYNEILKRFNLGDLATRDTYSTLIGGQVSAAELTDRVVNVYDRVRNADPALRAEIDRVESLGGGLTDADFAKALLTGPEGANELKRKISVAEITAEARVRGKRLEEQGYLPGLSVESAGDLQRLGVTRAQARAGFEQIALTQPRLSQLSEIYTRETPEATELQTELEREQFQGLSSERRRRLAEQETASFMGSSGTQGIGLRGRSRRGQI
jgi:hypothetical protein